MDITGLAYQPLPARVRVRQLDLHERQPYELPTVGCYEEWRGVERRDFTPSPRQRNVIESVRRALAAGCYYSTDVREFCKNDLKITPEQDTDTRERVEGGTFGFDLYYARDYLRAQWKFAAEDAAIAELELWQGRKLPPLMFSDCKLTKAVTVEAVSEGGHTVSLRGRRGSQTVRFPSVTPLQIKNAITRAAEQAARRKDQKRYRGS